MFTTTLNTEVRIGSQPDDRQVKILRVRKQNITNRLLVETTSKMQEHTILRTKENMRTFWLEGSGEDIKALKEKLAAHRDKYPLDLI